MGHLLVIAAALLEIHGTRSYPIDLELRRAHRAQRGSRRTFPRLRAFAARLAQGRRR